MQETSQKQGKRKEKSIRGTAPTKDPQARTNTADSKQKRSGKQTRNKSGKNSRREKHPPISYPDPDHCYIENGISSDGLSEKQNRCMSDRLQ